MLIALLYISSATFIKFILAIIDVFNLIKSFNSDSAVCCWDFGHANLMKMDQSYALEYLGKRIVCTHVHNNNGRDDRPGTGFNGPVQLTFHQQRRAVTKQDTKHTAKQ